MLTENLLRIPFSVNHRRLLVSISSVKINALGSLKVVTVGFSNLLNTVISKKQAKNLSLIFSSNKKQKIVKTIRSCTASTCWLLWAIKKIFISWHISSMGWLLCRFSNNCSVHSCTVTLPPLKSHILIMWVSFKDDQPLPWLPPTFSLVSDFQNL